MGTRADYAYGNSEYLKAEKLAGKSTRVIISDVEDVEFEKGLKPVLSFEGKEKKLPLNTTNFDTLATISPRTEDWIGHAIILRGEKVLFKGKMVDSIRAEGNETGRRDPALEASAMTCSVCGAEPCINRSFCRTCRDADKRRTRSKHKDERLNDARPTPQATIEAVMHAVHARGVAALKEPAIAARLERCDAAAQAEIEQRIASLRKD